MFPIQPRRGRQRHKKLAPIGIRPAIRHAQYTRARVFERSADLVLELFAVHGAAAAAGAGRVAALDHEGGDDAVEDCVVVVAAGGEGAEVSAGAGGVLGVEFYDYIALDCVEIC